ncbi:Ger(x)C family spore germination C-terminal domain-containing protein [Virgibacillus byunsanensis]|uniref:Ger(X)C family spore germination C-terminal domain-containing protein n=1 Tax=Virgibacillus byunsanensis TaxID=570945 RepID=A0ABW3LGT4_9BACI
MLSYLLKQEFKILLEQLQSLKSDPFGYGKLYKSHTASGTMKEDEWREKFPNINVDFEVNVRILRQGTTQ